MTSGAPYRPTYDAAECPATGKRYCDPAEEEEEEEEEKGAEERARPELINPNAVHTILRFLYQLSTIRKSKLLLQQLVMQRLS